ncbi:5-histidylcysteine sulfoxide synthase [Methyloversatilis thermotolerans]|uniref:5-histidylcysteine sulfoxide synthase n=1 Tax=Methyloversatilis thermotolerans TaxID=1346290 RepID=UPI00037B76D4|nr:5-histidylcysteine sulfoxide synthase [Methyloversatilis thermotolerans]
MNAHQDTLFPRTPRLDGLDPQAMRDTLRDYFHATCTRYEQLFEVLACDEAWTRKPISLRHPLIFYFGHTATFFVNKLLLAGLIDARIDPRMESMFAVGVDEMSWDDLNEANYDWPSVQAVRDYRNEVRRTVDRVIREAPLTLPIGWNHPWWSIVMGIEHERIHLETSSVLIRQSRLDFVRPHPAWAPCRDAGEPPANTLVAVPSGRTQLGKRRDDPLYGWDNEYETRAIDVTGFEAARQLTSNREFLEFVDDGGYRDDAWWDEEGRQWRDFRLQAGIDHPEFWVRRPDGWHLRLMLQEVAMPWNWPVETNCHEARAFCRWKAARLGRPVRLPTEDEWYRLYDVAGVAEIPADARASANLHLDHWASSCPVDRFAQGDFFDVAGNVWQWTETPIYPFEGFDVHPIYDDFSTPTFDARHNLMKGGSWISCGNEAIRASRYAFRRHFFQHAGFRYVISDAPASAPNVYYESDRQLSEYAEFHYGDEYYGVANFPRALAHMAIEAMGERPARHALDLGCATGRATFELARHFDRVTGVDFSARFINAGVQLAEQGVLRYTLVDEGELVSYRTRRLADLGLDGVRGKVDFVQGDACNLKSVLTGYDLILAANLIDRLYDPKAFLASVHARLNTGGLLLIASPYTWLEEHTRREDWLGGFKKDGESWTTLDGLREALAPGFRLLGAARDVPFVIRETRRKFQHTLSEVTIWEKLS